MAGGFRVDYSFVKNEFAAAITGKASPMAVAATAAIDKTGDDVKSQGRANIAAAGLGKKFSNALRVTRYPKSGVSMDAALWIFHKIPYAEVFESGATIHGKPILWIPLSSTPKKIGGKRMTVKNYREKVGPLVSINVPGKPPLLAAKIKGHRRKVNGKITLARLKAGLKAPGQLVPLFVGIDAVSIRKRLGLRAIFAKAAGNLENYYFNSLKDT